MQPFRLGLYRHYKHGTVYHAVMTVFDEKTYDSTRKELVIYVPYGRESEKGWARDQKEFEDYVMHEGKSVKRFTFLK